MQYSKVYLEAITYELPPVVITSEELEERLAPVYRTLSLSMGQLEQLTGIEERRWWSQGFLVSEGAIKAARKLLAITPIPARDIDVLIYAGVCRDSFEPATATIVANALTLSPNALIYDLSNACLGVINGIIDIANRIELGHSRAGLIVSCETAREINDITIERLLAEPTMENFAESLATFTGGSGAVALLLSDGSYSSSCRHRLLGGAVAAAPEFCRLCRWGLESGTNGLNQRMYTDSVAVLENGVKLGIKTWRQFLKTMNWQADDVDHTICHQVGESHRRTILENLGIPPAKDFITYPFLGNIGTVSLPITAAIADQRQILRPGDNVAFLGIGSGLNCMMLGWKW